MRNTFQQQANPEQQASLDVSLHGIRDLLAGGFSADKAGRPPPPPPLPQRLDGVAGVRLEHSLEQQLAVSRSRPSVSQRKTVNAVYADGRVESVFAQNYAVLVTDVAQGLYGETLRRVAACGGTARTCTCCVRAPCSRAMRGREGAAGQRAVQRCWRR